MVISIVKLVVCFCLYASFCFKFPVVYSIIQRDSKHNSERNLNQYRSDDYQVKYPIFNKVMARIDNLNDEAKTKNNMHRLRHKDWKKYTTTTTTTTTTEADLFDSYGDFNEEDYSESYDDNQVRAMIFNNILVWNKHYLIVVMLFFQSCGMYEIIIL